MLFKALHIKVARNFATKLQAASTKNKKDSAGKRLGVKIFGSEVTYPNDVLIRQRGFKWKPGVNTLYGRDHTIHSTVEGVVKFTKEYEGNRKITTVHVIPKHGPNKKHRPPLPYCYHPELYPELAKFNPPPVESVPTPFSKKLAEKPKRTDLPKKVGTTSEMFGVKLPEHLRSIKQIEEIEQIDENEMDVFESYTNEVNRRYSKITEHLSKHE